MAEPTGLAPVRGHRSHIAFTATRAACRRIPRPGSRVNANWILLPFLVAMRELHDRLRSDPALQDAAYTPPFSDFNLVLDNQARR